jgi:hypothetical protein
MPEFHLVTNSVTPSQVRETGDAYVIRDVPFVRPMDLAGGYVPRESIRETVDAWAGVPVTLNHPRNARGQPVAANRQPETHLGVVERPRFDADGDVARADVRIRKARLDAVDGAERVREALDSETPLDVSSQYAARDLPPGEYDGAMRENVEAIARPDSLAVLPDKEGRCSLADGCGIDPQLAANAALSIPMTRANAEHGGEDMDSDGGTADGAGMDAAAVAYEPTPVAPADVDAWTDAEWDGSDAIAAMPNPSEDDDAPGVLDRTHAAVPTGEEARDRKAAWKLPFREGPAAPVNTRALVAIDAALSGGRGGVEGLGDDVRSTLSDWVGEMLAAAPDDLFGAAGDDDQSANALERLGRQVAGALGLVAAGDAQAANEGAESPVDAETDSATSETRPADASGTAMDNRDDLIDEITANSAITAASLEGACDERVQLLHDDVVSNSGDGDGGSGDDGGEGDDLAERLERIESQMVTEDDLDDLVANERDEQTRDELARAIVANSSDYDDPEAVREDFPTTEALEAKRDALDTPATPPAGGIAANVGDDDGVPDDVDLGTGVLTE